MTLYTPIANTSSGIQELIADALAEGLAKDQETLVLAELQPNTWTNIPASVDNPTRAIAGLQLRSSSGESLPLDSQMIGGTWQIRSAIALTNVQILLEY
jgi:hypothetical protein